MADITPLGTSTTGDESEPATRQALEQAIGFWRQRLEIAEHMAAIQYDYPSRSDVPNWRWKHCQLMQTPQSGRSGANSGVAPSLRAYLYGAIAISLYRYSGSRDIVIGISENGSSEESTVPLVFKFDPEETCENLLIRIVTDYELADQHNVLPPAKITELLAPIRADRPPYHLTVQWTDRASFDQAVQTPPESSHTEFKLLLAPVDGVVHAALGCDANRYAERTSAGFLKVIHNAFDNMVTNPQQVVSDVNLLTEDERKQNLFDYNKTEVDYQVDADLCALFEKQVKRSPDAPAFICGSLSLTYSDLNLRANQLANHLMEAGIRRTSLVAISIDRSLDLMVALMAVLKTGAAYVALDPDYPIARLQAILDDAQPALILLQKRLDRFERYQGNKIYTDAEARAVSKRSSSNPKIPNDPNALLHIVYTSASTGTPKGVKVGTAAILNRLHWMWRTYPFAAGEVAVLQKSIALVASSWECYGGLLCGIPTVILTGDEVRDPSLLWHRLIDQKVSRLLASPPLLQGLIEQAEIYPEQQTSLKLATTSAEPISPSLVKRWHSAFKNVPLLNLYGYTECCSNVTCYNTDDFDTSLLRVPIGKPIANTFVYVLDERLKPVPPGTIGELCVAGACLAQGYLNLDELTNQSFVRNPYAKPGAERLFRTGDLVRLGPDQKLELVGRLDNRVNIRGFRVDLEDIEATLMRYAGIERCAVVSFDSEDLNKLLVAFICMHQPITIGEIRSYARDQLPDYMVPGEFVFLDQMPLTINGKIDRKALPLPERIRPASNVGFVAPETDIEKAVAAIWSDVLNIESIGVNDNFFDLGGHSLIGSRIAARIREIIGITLPLRSIFDAPTIKSLAAAIVRLDFDQANLNTNLIHFLGDQTSGSPARNQEEANIGSFPDSATDSSVTITAGSLGVPLSYGQQQLWVHEQFSPGNSTFNLAAAYRIIGPLNYEALQDSIRSIIRRHSILRTYFIAGEEEPRQVIDETVSFDLPLLDLENLSELERTQQLDYWIRQEATKPFDLEHAPLMRARVLSLHSTESILLLTFHHLVFDGWSWGIFLSDLETQYRALSTGNETDLPSLPMQYADYAARQRRKTNRAAMAECLSYWKGRLQDAPEVLDIGLDKPRPRTQSFSGKHYRTMVDADLFGRLEEFAHKNSITLFTVLSAAFKLLLRHRSLNDDIVVGTPIANRDAINTELLIGYFINNLPLRTSLGGNPTFTELLERERDTILNAYIHPELVLAQLLVELGRPRQLQHFPIYQVMLIMLDSGWRTVRLHGLEVHAIDTDSYASQLDLTVFARPTAQGLSLTFEYNTDLFEPDTILKLAGDLIAILELAVTRPELNIDDFSRNLDERMLTASDLLRVAFIREARKCLLATNRKSIRLESSPSKRSTAGKTG